MTDPASFGLLVLLVGATGLAAVLSNRLTAWLPVPAPALFLAAAALAGQLVPSLQGPPHRTVEPLVTLALVAILFHGGMQIGWRRFRATAGPIVGVGIGGTVLTTAAMAVLAHLLFGLDWYVAVLLATALAPTDPAVVFSVLGSRELAGRGGTILEGESGANDPVGIALMVSLLAAGGLSADAATTVGVAFASQMILGAAVGLVGGRVLVTLLRRVALPGEALYPLQTLAFALLVFGAATVASGSGFLAVFVAGIVLGDEPTPYRQGIRRFHDALASLGEIVAFVALGLTVDLGVLARSDVWAPGLALGALLALVVRPVLVGLCLLPALLPRNERVFVLLAGLKGAVPILLGSFLVTAAVPGADRLYGIVVVVVATSVVVQGGLVPTAVRVLRLPLRGAADEDRVTGDAAGTAGPAARCSRGPEERQ